MTTVVEVMRLSGPMVHMTTEELFELLRPDPNDSWTLQPSIPVWREVDQIVDVVEMIGKPMRRSDVTKIEQSLARSGLFVDRQNRIAVRRAEKLR